MSIAPDTKDWTWVLHRACPECGLDVTRLTGGEIAGLVRANASTWQQELARADVHRRPRPDVWSALEYGCHVRDVYQLFDRRLELMLTVDDPRFDNWDQDATAVQERYGDQQPDVVAAQLGAAAASIADRFVGVSGEQWQRTGSRSDGALFTVETFARYLLHDVVHHLDDVRIAPAG